MAKDTFQHISNKHVGNILNCLSVSAIHEDKEGPAPEEIFTAILVNDSKVAFKSGFDKYLSIDKNGRVTGRSDAVGPLEQWEPVIEDDQMALLGANQCFMSVQEDDDSIVATSRKAGKIIKD